MFLYYKLRVSLKIQVQVKTKSSFEKIEQIDSTNFIVKVSVPPVDGKANERIVELLSKHFKVPKSKIHLILGMKSKIKVFEIETD